LYVDDSALGEQYNVHNRKYKYTHIFIYELGLIAKLTRYF